MGVSAHRADFKFALLIASAVCACNDRPTPAPATVVVQVAPAVEATLSKATVRFTAKVTGTTNSQVTWSVVEGDAGGTVAADGTYTAPEGYGVFHIRATSRADSSARAAASIEVTAVFPIDEGPGPVAVSGSAPNDVWVVGMGRRRHWNGSTWTAVDVLTESGAHPFDLQAIWANASNNVWEAGIGESALEIRYRDGLRWNVLQPITGGFVFDLWGTGPSNMWAVGTNVQPVVHHWTGAVLASRPLEPAFGSVSSLSAVWGSADDDVWAVGLGDEAGTNTRGAAVFHWNGTDWTHVRCGLTHSLLGIWGSAANDVWTVGEDGFLAHWNGAVWSPMPSGVTGTLWSVWGSAANDVWAVGDADVILHWNGTAWSRFPAPMAPTTTFRDIWGSSPDDVWVVGRSAIVHLPR